ncbi:MAG: N-acetylornithine carbamoyltransferase [Rhodothermia bacterium]|nr:N-acetylornithine carbamoyltransferase [Rhodothermia bacterium]
MNHLIGWHHLDHAEWNQALKSSLRLGQQGKAWDRRAEGKSLCLMFFNPSLRTRASMEVASAQLGARATTISPGAGTWQMAFDDGAVMDGPEAEHIQEAVGVLSKYFDAIGVRVFASLSDYHKDSREYLINRFAAAADVPVINLESAFCHPCQELADASTIMEALDGDPRGRKFVLTWCYHPKALPMAVANSAVSMAARLGMDVVVARPEGYELDETVMNRARQYAEAAGGSLTESTNQDEALAGAHVVYAKSWAGRAVYDDPDAEAASRAQLHDWRVTEERMSRTDNGVFMHCLPVRRNVVVDDGVLDGPHAIHLRQAEYRLYAQKAILESVWNLKSAPG